MARFTIECLESTKDKIVKSAKKENKSLKDYILDKLGVSDE